MASGRRVAHQINKVDGEVELAQRLAALEVLDLGDVVEREVEVVELLQPVQTLDLRDEIVLQVHDLQATAAVEYLDLVDVELVQRYLLERGQHALVVLRLAADHVLGDRHTVALGLGISLQSRRGGRRLLFLLLALTLALRRLLLLIDLLDHWGIVIVVQLLDDGHLLFVAAVLLPWAALLPWTRSIVCWANALSAVVQTDSRCSGGVFFT